MKSQGNPGSDEHLVITIDGPAGSGKSTVARKLAKKLSFVHLNSGLLYRALARYAQLRGLDLEDDGRLAALALELQFRFVVSTGGTTRFFVGAEDLTDQLTSSEAGELASQIAVLPRVREVLTRKAQEFAKISSLVVEGRDAGTVIFPLAKFKFYLDAAPRIRAERRFAQLQRDKEELPPEKVRATLKQLEADLEQRDTRDSTRKVAPQRKADDAVLIDTSALSADEVVEKLYHRVSAST